MLIKVYGSAVFGVEAQTITVEVNIDQGVGYHLVGLEVYGVDNVKEVIEFFDAQKPLEPTVVDTREEFYKNLDFPEFDFSDVKGQESIKRCMEIAAAGGHNIIAPHE